MYRARIAAFAALTIAALATPQLATAAPARPSAPAAKPGLVGSLKVLANTVNLAGGADVATDAKGNTYIGWIAGAPAGGSRNVYLCTLPSGSTSCKGGTKTIPSLDTSEASGLKVLSTASGNVTLVWYIVNGGPGGTPGGRIVESTSVRGATPSAPTDSITAPNNGQLLDATLGPDAKVWTLANDDGSKLEVRDGAGAPTTLTAPFTDVNAQLAFAGSKAIIAIQQAAFITKPVSYASGSGSSYSAFHVLAHTWTAGANIGLVSTKSGVRLFASVDNADYSPVVSKWTGSGFSARALTEGTPSCTPSSHDTVTDASGRVADVSNECGGIAVTNLPDTTHAAVVQISAHGTLAGISPQIGSLPSGRAWVVWGVQSTTGTKLYAGRVLLPGLGKSASKSVSHGRVTVTGPATCLPAVQFTASVSGKAARGWKVSKKTLLLNSAKHSASLNGASLRANTSYSLTGEVTFTKGSSHVTGKATLKFRTCPKP
jgi:hypothetical protein